MFSCFLPHCPIPLTVAKYMHKAAEYTQKRLGGVVLNELEKPFDVKEFENEVISVKEKMIEAGVKPGSPFSYELF